MNCCSERVLSSQTWLQWSKRSHTFQASITFQALEGSDNTNNKQAIRKKKCKKKHTRARASAQTRTIRCTRAPPWLQNQNSQWNACIFLGKKTTIYSSGQANADCHTNNSKATVEDTCCSLRKKKMSLQTLQATIFFFFGMLNKFGVCHTPHHSLSHKQSHAECPKHIWGKWIWGKWIKASKTTHPQMKCNQGESASIYISKSSCRNFSLALCYDHATCLGGKFCAAGHTKNHRCRSKAIDCSNSKILGWLAHILKVPAP